MHTTPKNSISTVHTLANIHDSQQPKQSNKIRVITWAKCRLVKVWPAIKKTLVCGAIIGASSAVVIGAGLGLAALYAAGYYGILYAIAILTAMLATPPILIILLCCNGVAG